MVREYPALVITDVGDLSKNSGNNAFTHLILCPDLEIEKLSETRLHKF